MLRNPDLHAAVLAAPRDDEPRLVYADWLLHHGDPRGELIAIQVARARLPADDRRAAELAARESELWATHEDTWFEPWRRYKNWEFRRGFVEELACRIPELDALDILAIDGCVRDLTIIGTDWDGGNVFGDLRDRLHQVRLDRLTLENCQYSRPDELLGEPAIAALESFALHRHWNLDIEAIMRAAPRWDRLRRLRLEACGLSREDVFALAAWPHASTLRTLDLCFNDLEPGTIDGIIDRPAFAGLEHLNLAMTNVGDEDVLGVCASGLRLRSLWLYEGAVGVTGASTIARSANLAGLESLNLGKCEIGAEGIAALVASPYLSPNLELVIDPDPAWFTVEDEWRNVPIPALADRFRVATSWDGTSMPQRNS